MIDIEDISKASSEPTSITKESQLIEDEAPWRRPTSIRLNQSNQNENPPKSECSGNIHESRFTTHLLIPYQFNSIEVPEKESTNALDTEVMLRRTQSFENDEK